MVVVGRGHDEPLIIISKVKKTKIQHTPTRSLAPLSSSSGATSANMVVATIRHGQQENLKKPLLKNDEYIKKQYLKIQDVEAFRCHCYWVMMLMVEWSEVVESGD